MLPPYPHQPEGMNAAQAARWLLCPTAFLVAVWWLYLRTATVTQLVPALWATGGKGVSEVLPQHPRTRTQAFDVGYHAARYEAACGNERWVPDAAACAESLRLAGEAVGAPGPLTPAQLKQMRKLIVDIDAERSVVDRVAGFFSFVNVVWLVAVIGLLATVGPTIVYLFGPMCLKLWGTVVLPVLRSLHEWGVFEAAAYTLAFCFCAQGCRYPAAQADAAVMVALTGGLGFIPCWAYSTALHTTGGGNRHAFMTITHSFVAGVLVPLALMHASRLAGFLAVLSMYGALGFVCFAFGSGFAVGFDGSNALYRCIFASVVLVLGFSSLRVAGADVKQLYPFSTGAMCLGNMMYFLALLILSSSWRRPEHLSYAARQALMLGSLAAAGFVGHVWVMPSMANTATTFLVLWLMEKELEVDWKGAAMPVLFANFAALYFIAHYLHTHPSYIVSLFDPKGLYV